VMPANPVRATREHWGGGMAVSGVRGGGGIDPLGLREHQPSARPAASGGTSGVEDCVTLSSAARAAQVPEKFRGVVASAHADPELAQQLAYEYANTDQAPIIDLSDLEAGTGPAKYAATGEPVTPESELRYKQMSGEPTCCDCLALHTRKGEWHCRCRHPREAVVDHRSAAC
jgi:hypothetical protein